MGVTDVARPSIALTMSDADNSDGHSSKEWIFPGRFSVSEYRANTVISSPKVVSDATYRWIHGAEVVVAELAADTKPSVLVATPLTYIVSRQLLPL